MSERNIKALFKTRLNNIRNKPYVPKFNVGDYILNKKYKICRKVIAVNGDVYVLENVRNPLTNPKFLNRDVYKECIKLDAYYEKIDERSAKILFGVNNGETKSNNN